MSSLSSTTCYKQKHSITPKSYIAPLMDSINCITLPVHYCETCCKYFIGDKTLREYEKHYGKYWWSNNAIKILPPQIRRSSVISIQSLRSINMDIMYVPMV